MFIDFPWIVWCIRDDYVAHSSGFCDNFPSCILFMKGDDSVMTVPAQCCFWRTCFWPFCSIATSSFDRIYQESNILWEAALAKLCFSVLCSSCFTHGTKAPWFLFHLALGRCDHKGFIHTLCFFILSAGSFPGPATNVQSGSPVKMLILIGGVFLDALLYYQ